MKRKRLESFTLVKIKLKITLEKILNSKITLNGKLPTRRFSLEDYPRT